MRLECVASRPRLATAFVLTVAAFLSVSTFPGKTEGAARAAATFFIPTEYVQTFAADCATPQTVFYLGDTVCARASGFPFTLTSRYRRFQWGAPDGTSANQTAIKVDPQDDKFIIPTTGTYAQPGTWVVGTINRDSDLFAAAKFIVRNPRIRYADLSITKAGPYLVLPGDTVSYRLRIYNPGPDSAEDIQIVDEVPSNMVFVALKQASGAVVDCSTPLRGETGRSVCRVKGMAPDEPVELVAYYQVNKDTRDGTVCTSSAQVTSLTEEMDKRDNFITLEVTAGSPGE